MATREPIKVLNVLRSSERDAGYRIGMCFARNDALTSGEPRRGGGADARVMSAVSTGAVVCRDVRRAALRMHAVETAIESCAPARFR